MKKMGYVAVVFACMCVCLCACASSEAEDSRTRQNLSKEETVLETDYADADKASGQILVLNDDHMLVQMHFPGAKMGVLETRTIPLDHVKLQKDFAVGEFVKILFDMESNKADAAESPGLGSGIVDYKTELKDVYMISSVLQPREPNPDVDVKVLRKDRKSNFLEGVVVDITDDYIEATIGSGKNGSVYLTFKEDTCGFIQPCFIGDKVSYCYFYDSVKPVEEEHDSPSHEWVEACLVSTDYGQYQGAALGYKGKEEE